MKTKGKIILLAIPICLVVVAFAAIILVSNADVEPDINNELIVAKLESISELATARLTYNGLLYYEEGKIPLLTKKAFFMIYHAEVKAGIDLSKTEVKVTQKNVTLHIPKAELFDIYIDPDSIQFYDEKCALFNSSDKNDAIEAISAAENDVREKASIDQLLDTANMQTSLLLENLFSDMIGDRTLVIHYQ